MEGEEGRQAGVEEGHGKIEALGCEPFSPLQPSKNARNPKFVQNLSRRLFWGVPVRGTEFGKICQNLSENYRFSNFGQIFPNFSPPDWNPPKQSPGQILDKFGVSGVFEGCKGEKGSQALGRQTSGRRRLVTDKV